MNPLSPNGHLLSHVDSVVEPWLEFALPPAKRAIEESQWTPDSSRAYCLRCGDSTGSGEATEGGCSTCREGAELAGGIGDGVVRLGLYTDPLQQWIDGIKYLRWIDMAEALGRMLGSVVRESNLIEPRRAVVVPMPMAWQRRWFRGVDHAHAVASGIADELKCELVPMLRKSMQPTQVSLAPSVRKKTSSRGVRIRNRWGGWPVQDRHIVLVDDVRTTGATLRATVRHLRALKSEKIVCAVIAVSDAKARRDRMAARLQHNGVQSPP